MSIRGFGPPSSRCRSTIPSLPTSGTSSGTRVFDAWSVLPPLAPVRVAVVDSGIDLGHPEFVGRIVAARSFVDGTVRDLQGHGTIVAGIVGAGSDNAIGITGLAPSAELIIARVVRGDRSIPVKAEAQAIRWAVDRGARVINMSLGGLRDPLDPSRDDYSSVEAAAIALRRVEGRARRGRGRERAIRLRVSPGPSRPIPPRCRTSSE